MFLILFSFISLLSFNSVVFAYNVFSNTLDTTEHILGNNQNTIDYSVNLFNNAGNGYILFNFIDVYSDDSNPGYNYGVSDVEIGLSSGQLLACDIGTITNYSDSDSTYNVRSVKCPVSLVNKYIDHLYFRYGADTIGYYNAVWLGYNATFVEEATNDDIISAIQSQNVYNSLETIKSQLGTIDGRLQNGFLDLYTRLYDVYVAISNGTTSIINNQNSNTQQIIDSIEDNFQTCTDSYTTHPSYANLFLGSTGTYGLSEVNSGGFIDVSSYVGKSITISFSGLNTSKNPRANYCFADNPASNTRVNCLSYNISTSLRNNVSYNVVVVFGL